MNKKIFAILWMISVSGMVLPVYYSEPNRVILFYQDAQMSAEYTPVGYFDYTDEFLQAVQNNPVLEGWGNKLVLISSGE